MLIETGEKSGCAQSNGLVDSSRRLNDQFDRILAKPYFRIRVAVNLAIQGSERIADGSGILTAE